MDSTAFVLLAVLTLDVLLLFQFTKTAETPDKQLRTLHRTLIREVPDGGVAKIVGKLRYIGEPLRTPLTGTPCAHFQVLVDEHAPTHASDGKWQRIVYEESSYDFLLEDETGTALIRMSAPRVAVTKETHCRSGLMNNTTPEMDMLLERHGYSGHRIFEVMNGRLRYWEGTLEEGDEVAVRGIGRWDVDEESSGSEQDLTTRRLIVDAPDAQPLFTSDDPAVFA